MSRIVIGIGNPDRGDDGAGRLTARLLQGRLLPEVGVLELSGEPTALLAVLEGAAAAILIDAASSGAPAGTVRRFDAAAGPLPAAAFTLSSHGIGLGEAIELARALGQLPARCVVFAIEGACFEAGAAVTPAVAAAAAEVARRVVEEIVRPG